MKALVLAILAGILLAACGSQAPAAPPASPTVPVNVTACQDYVVQRAHMSKLVTPTVVDVAEFTGWVKMDSGKATGELSADFGILYTDLSTAIGVPGSSTYGVTVAANQLKYDCGVLGVKV